MNKCIGYKESDVGHETKSIKSYMDQGDALSLDWLEGEALIGIQGYYPIPIKVAFAPLTTTHPLPP